MAPTDTTVRKQRSIQETQDQRDAAQAHKPAAKPQAKQAKPAVQAPVREVEVASAPVPQSAPVRPATGMAPIREDAPAVQNTSSSGDGYVIQLSSTPSQADAERSEAAADHFATSGFTVSSTRRSCGSHCAAAACTSLADSDV